jgi:hypothetical protein
MPTTASSTATPAPTYVLIADFSSLVIRRIAINVIESAISGVRQDGIRLSFVFRISGRGELNFEAWWRQDIGLARKNRV